MISDDTFVLLNLALTFGVPLVLGIRELRSIRRSRGGDNGGSAEREPRPSPLPGNDGLPPLPVELVALVTDARAKASTEPAREREPA